MLSDLLDNPQFYVSVFSSVCFVCSEILPFLPIKSNGILHAILLFLSSYRNYQPSLQSKEEDVEKEDKNKEN